MTTHGGTPMLGVQSDGTVDAVGITSNAAHVSIVQTSAGAGAVDQRIARFDAVADMPADITSSVNVAADRIKFDSFAATARRIRLIWHGAGIAGPDTQATQAFFGEIALGARITVNAPDDSTANTRLTYTDITGASTSSSGAADTFMVSKSNAMIELVVDEAITRIDAIGIPNGLSTTHIDTILPCFLEVQVIG
jgi:hypothetical protein